MDNLLKSLILTPFNLLYRVNPEWELRLLFRLKCGYPLNLEDPHTYNEKLQWIKLHDRNPLMPVCCDKYTVREYVKGKGCEELLNEMIWEGYDPEEIPFDQLPDRFVLKVTHGSSFNIICRDKSTLNRKFVIEKCRKWLNAKFLEAYGEWFYGIERPRILIEKYLDDGTPRLRDYKVYCFHGIPRFIGVDLEGERDGVHYKDIYDTEWNLIPGYEMAYPNSGIPIEKPMVLDRMMQYAHILSEDFIHARVDFYVVEGRIIFGEITFTNSAGFGRIQPREFAMQMGDYMKLPVIEEKALKHRR